MIKRFIGKALVLGLLGTAGVMAQAAEGKGGGCGWGNMVFEGQRGLGPHLLATTTNGTSGNATFGLTSGTNGCDSSVTIHYSGRSLFAMNGMPVKMPCCRRFILESSASLANVIPVKRTTVPKPVARARSN